VQVPMAHDLYMIWHVKGSVDSDYDCVAYDSVHSGDHCSGGTCCLGRWYIKDEGSMFETLATTCHQVTYCYDPETQNLNVR